MTTLPSVTTEVKPEKSYSPFALPFFATSAKFGMWAERETMAPFFAASSEKATARSIAAWPVTDGRAVGAGLCPWYSVSFPAIVMASMGRTAG